MLHDMQFSYRFSNQQYQNKENNKSYPQQTVNLLAAK